MFTLEALKAKHGDALVLYWGDEADSRLVVIDGGPSGTWRRALGPRLEDLRRQRDLDDDEPLDIDMLMVSHIDDDHIRGVLDLTAELVGRSEDGRPLPFRIRTLWHNSFDDVVGNGAEPLFTAGLAEVGAASAADLMASPDTPGLSRSASLVLASVPQGRRLRDAAAVLGLAVNQPGGGLIVAREGDATVVRLEDDLELFVLGPSGRRVADLQRRWDEELERRGLGEPATVRTSELLDESVANLASIVVLARRGDRSMLLTGDARADDILAGLRNAGLLDEGTFHVDLLKVPHHGSDRNVDTDFFRTVTADHYVVSGDGRHGNPEPATFEMLLNARGDAELTLHLTYPPSELGHDYPVAELESLFARARADGKRFVVHGPGQDEVSLTVAL